MMIRRPLIFGHRGAMGHAPENTRAAFEAGWRLGADAVECDVHLSADGELVVMHDDSLDRTTSGSGLIRLRRWSSIKTLDAGSWFHRRFRKERVWRLMDLLRWIADKKTPAGRPLGLILEVKNEKGRPPVIADRVAEAISGGDVIGRTWVISFDPGVCRRVKDLCPEVRTGFLFGEPLPCWASRVKALGADGLFPRWNLVTPALVRAAHKRRLFVGTYTVNDEDALRRVASAGVDGLATNFPDRIMVLLKNKETRRRS